MIARARFQTCLSDYSHWNPPGFSFYYSVQWSKCQWWVQFGVYRAMIVNWWNETQKRYHLYFLRCEIVFSFLSRANIKQTRGLQTSPFLCFPCSRVRSSWRTLSGMFWEWLMCPRESKYHSICYLITTVGLSGQRRYMIMYVPFLYLFLLYPYFSYTLSFSRKIKKIIKFKLIYYDPGYNMSCWPLAWFLSCIVMLHIHFP